MSVLQKGNLPIYDAIICKVKNKGAGMLTRTGVKVVLAALRGDLVGARR